MNSFGVRRKISENSSFLLTNRSCGYASMSNKPISRYQGVCFAEDGKLYKVISNILLVKEEQVTNLTKKFWSIERKRKTTTESMFFPLQHNIFVYELDNKEEFKILLDIRGLYDNRKFGKFYELFEENNKIIIKYTKRTSSIEDSSEGLTENTFYLVIASPELEGKKIGKWVKLSYEYDKLRNSPPAEEYVFEAIALKTTLAIFSFSKNKEKAMREADYVLLHLDELKQKQSEESGKVIHAHHKNIPEKEIALAHKCALNAIDSLVCRIDSKIGIYAGLWWFFQFWTRDEAVSLKALMFQKKYDEAKEIAFRLLKNINDDGNICSMYFPETGGISADSVGWIFKRFQDLLEHNQLNNYEIEIIKQKLKSVIDALVKNNTINSLAINAPKQTWMDSIDREGARIEVQALRLNMYHLMAELSKRTNNRHDEIFYEELENVTKKSVRQQFWNGKILADGLGDWAIRPNIFIAYYIYPELLSKEEWIVCFKNIIKSLWLDWGGLATIDKKSRQYRPQSTGEIPLSYHDGDSWYWLNNLAAICMHRLDKKTFHSQIKKILDASSSEILYSGIIGHHAELSSASEQESAGCLAQAWSSAMFIELIDELY